MKKINLSIAFGIIAGIIISLAWYAFAKSTGFYTLDIYTYKFYTATLLLLFGIFLSIYIERKRQGGFIEFKIALKSGLLFTIIFSLIFSIYNYLYHKFIATDAIDFFVSEERKAWLIHNRKLEEVNKYLIEYYIPSFGAFHTFMTSLIWGVLLSLLASAIFQKKKTTPFSAN